MATDTPEAREAKRLAKKIEKARKAAARAGSHRSPMESRKVRCGPRSRRHK